MVNPQDQWRLQESEKRGGEGKGGEEMTKSHR